MTANTQNTLVVFIGRFQPFHQGHLEVLKKASKISDNILMLVGSSYRPRSWKNTFTYQERTDLIRYTVNRSDVDAKVDFLPMVDTLYDDDAWVSNVKTAVGFYKRNRGMSDDTKVILVGFNKDSSSDYLGWFPHWEMEDFGGVTANGEIINATDFRESIFFREDDMSDLEDIYGRDPVDAIRLWRNLNPEAVAYVRNEAEFLKETLERTKRAEKEFGFPIPVRCADSLITQSGHILLVERKNAPGKGLYALPGGHVEPTEDALGAAIRETRGETKIDMPRGLFLRHLKERRPFDHPKRSERGWVSTDVFRFELEDKPLSKMEKVKGADDARRAFWMPLEEITPENMFEDHFDIIQAMGCNVPFAYTSILMAQAA